MKPKIKIQSGFTLVELLVVISIIGMLASIAVVSFNNARYLAMNGRTIADARQLQQAIELYYQKNGVYPPATDQSGIDMTYQSYQQDFLTSLVSDGEIAAPVQTVAYPFLYINYSQLPPSEHYPSPNPYDVCPAAQTPAMAELWYTVIDTSNGPPTPGGLFGTTNPAYPACNWEGTALNCYCFYQ